MDETTGSREPREPRQPREPMRFTCSGCAETWTGTRRAHCSGCHRTFDGATWFDRHRRGGQCLDPASIETLRFDDGLWKGPRRA